MKRAGESPRVFCCDHLIALNFIALSATVANGRKIADPRTFKTSWFAKAARKARISDVELCQAVEQVRNGQADDLGGGVFKKRLNKNRHRSILLARGRRYWSTRFYLQNRTARISTMMN
jgi:hypothetical protein